MAVTVDISSGRGGITLDTSVEELMQAFGVDKAAFKRAQVRALNKTTRWIYGKFARHLQNELKSKEQLLLTQTMLKKRMRQSMAKGSKLQASLWVGLYNMPLIRLGKGRSNSTGYRVKGRQVDGGFLAKMRSGHEGIYRRVGKDRFPIKESTLKMRASASVVLQRLLPLAEAELEKKLKQELNYEMHRKMGAV